MVFNEAHLVRRKQTTNYKKKEARENKNSTTLAEKNSMTVLSMPYSVFCQQIRGPR